MAEQRVGISVRGEGSWKGISTITVMGRQEFLPKSLINCYISPDGRELRSFPGFKCVVNADYETEFTDALRVDWLGPTEYELKAWSRLKVLHGFMACRGRTAIVGEAMFRRYKPIYSIISVNILSAVNVELTMSADPSATLKKESYIYIEGLTHAQNVQLNGKFFLVTNVVGGGSGSVTISGGAFTGAGNNADTGTAHTVRQTTPGGTIHDQDLSALSVFWVEKQFDVTKAIKVLYPSHVANRQRDFGSSNLNSYQEGYRISPAPLHPGQSGTSRRKQKALPFKVGIESAGDRIVIPAPGYGCVFQVPVVVPNRELIADAGIESGYSGNHDKPRSLGIPKGMLLESSTGASGAGGAIPDGDYMVAIAYKDQYTGEIGLASDAFKITVGVGETIYVGYIHPGYVMSECLGLSLMLYASGVGQQALGFIGEYDIDEYGIPPNAIPGADLTYQDVSSFVTLNVTFDWTKNIEYKRPPRRIPQMFMGGKCAAVIRGFTFIGGHHGSHGLLKSMQAGGLDSAFVSLTDNDFKLLDEVHAAPFSVKAGVEHSLFNMALGGIPPAYAGSSIFSDRTPYGKHSGEELFKPPIKIAVLDKIRNPWGTNTAGQPYRWLQRWKTKGSINLQGVVKGYEGKSAYLILPKGHVSFSEQGVPGAVPGINRIYLDNSEEEDTELLGRSGNSLIACTRNQTFTLSWGASPLGSNPALLSSEIGSIAYNSFVEHNKGAAWIGERGPVLLQYGGMPTWMIDMEEDFIGESATYLRDSRGMMPHAWASHDRERSLVYFGLRSDVHNTDYADAVEEKDSSGKVIVTQDGARSKVPCDDILVWSYLSNSFSKWRPPSGLAIHWMERILCADGVYRMCFLAEDGRIYALDDAYVDTNKSPVVLSSSGAGTGTTVAMTAAPAPIDAPGVSTVIDADNAIRTGMNVIQYRIVSGVYQFLAKTTVKSLPGGNDLEMAKQLTWEIGDSFLIGGVEMSFETHAETFGDLQEPKRALTASVRHSVFSNAVEGFQGPACWVDVTASSEIRENQPMSRNPREISRANKEAHQTLCNNQSVSGHELRFKLEAFGGQQIRVADFEIARASKRE